LSTLGCLHPKTFAAEVNYIILLEFANYLARNRIKNDYLPLSFVILWESASMSSFSSVSKFLLEASFILLESPGALFDPEDAGSIFLLNFN
jgi:hypothetical protein